MSCLAGKYTRAEARRTVIEKPSGKGSSDLPPEAASGILL